MVVSTRGGVASRHCAAEEGGAGGVGVVVGGSGGAAGALHSVTSQPSTPQSHAGPGHRRLQPLRNLQPR